MTRSSELAAECKAGLRFLVIEDLVQLAGITVEYLRALDFEAEVASTGEAALRLLSSRSFDVALVGIDLPDTTGFEVVALAAASGWLGRTRIIFCTGSRSEEYQQRAAHFPGSRFLWKPFAFPDLMKCVSEITAGQV
jgi:DNA-binding response OmpR family regulator